jgi:hypothetical protein
MEEDYAELLELVFQKYEASLDLDVALSVVPMSPEARTRLTDDPDLRARVMLCDSRVREDLMVRVRVLAQSAVSEGVKLQALKELGRTLYPKRFKDLTTTPILVALKRGKAPAEPWPEEYVASVVADMQAYVDESDFPTMAEFCYTRGIGLKKVAKHQELLACKELMEAKQQAMMIRRGWSGDDSMSTFLTKLAGNTGPFSLVDKGELTGKDGEPIPVSLIKRVVVDP